MTWYHRTCEHAAPQIVASGLILRPNPQSILAGSPLTWFTRSPSATRVMLGLSSHTLSCDRMSHLFEVIPEDEDKVMWWGDVKRTLAAEPMLPAIRRLEAVRGTRPGLWGVTGVEVRVEPVLT